ncbi:hypothetical protein VYU27_000891 [Nannochloropsis oceanica]
MTKGPLTNKDKPSANTTRTDASVPVYAAAERRRTTGSMRHVSQSPPVDRTVFHQGVLLMLAGTAVAYTAIRMVWALIRLLPFIAVGMYCMKPSLESFMESLSLRDKRSSNSGTSMSAPAPSSATSNSKPGGWLKKVVSKTIEKTSSAWTLNPVREWLYLDLGLFMLCKKKPSAFQGLSAVLGGGTASLEPKAFAIGVCSQWALLDPSTFGSPGEGSWLKIYAYELACLLSSQWPDDKWNTFSSLPAVQRRNDTQLSAAVDAVVAATANVVGEAWKEVVEASSNQCNSNISSISSRDRHTSVVKTNSPSTDVSCKGAVAGMMEGMGNKPMMYYMHLAQEMAERGRFEEAGRAVEAGLEKTRRVLKGGVEEETEFLLVACSFYEAGIPSSYQCATRKLRVLEQAAGLCVVNERWAKASALFEECLVACIEDERNRGHSLVVMERTVLSCVLAQLMVGDFVKAEALHNQVCGKDARYQKTREAELVTNILRGIHTHNPKVIEEAALRYQQSREGGREEGKNLNDWQERVLRHVMKRADAAVLL